MEFHELQQIVESNARSIQALTDRQSQASQERQELREAVLRVIALTEGIANLTASLDEDRPTVLRKLNNIEQKLDRLLEQEGNGS